MEHGDQYQLKLVYEHNLQRTACNMTYGSFGGVTGMADILNLFYLGETKKVRTGPFQLDSKRLMALSGTQLLKSQVAGFRT